VRGCVKKHEIFKVPLCEVVVGRQYFQCPVLRGSVKNRNFHSPVVRFSGKKAKFSQSNNACYCYESQIFEFALAWYW